MPFPLLLPYDSGTAKHRSPAKPEQRLSLRITTAHLPPFWKPILMAPEYTDFRLTLGGDPTQGYAITAHAPGDTYARAQAPYDLDAVKSDVGAP